MPDWMLLAAAALSALLPPALAHALGGTESAWAYVCYGLESALLWACIGQTSATVTARIIAAWGFMEAAERAAGRLYFPMDHPVKLEPGQGLADAAFGFPMSWVSVFAALFVAVVYREVKSES